MTIQNISLPKENLILIFSRSIYNTVSSQGKEKEKVGHITKVYPFENIILHCIISDYDISFLG